MSFKTPFLCDRRVYDKKGYWQNPNQDVKDTFFYFVKEPLTLVPRYDNYGREQMEKTMTIVVFGSRQIIKEDTLFLENGETFKVENITLNYFESNVLVKDMLKPRVESMELTLV